MKCFFQTFTKYTVYIYSSIISQLNLKKYYRKKFNIQNNGKTVESLIKEICKPFGAEIHLCHHHLLTDSDGLRKCDTSVIELSENQLWKTHLCPQWLCHPHNPELTPRDKTCQSETTDWSQCLENVSLPFSFLFFWSGWQHIRSVRSDLKTDISSDNC